MAVSIKGEALMPADRLTVWAKLNDPDVLRGCIPGCDRLVQTGDNTFQARAHMRVGPLTATIRGEVNLSHVEPPHGYHIAGLARGGFAGYAQGDAAITLAEHERGTRLCYDVRAQIGGRFGRLGGLVTDLAARRIADAFLSRLAAAMTA